MMRSSGNCTAKGSRSRRDLFAKTPLSSAASREMTSLGIVLVLASLSVATHAAGKLPVRHAWKKLDFQFPDDAFRKSLEKEGAYVDGNAIPIDVQPLSALGGKGSQRRVLVTMPRFKTGVPATLATLVSEDADAPLLTAYPDWKWNKQGNCEGVTSVFRVQVDPCGRLWVLDTGTVDILSAHRNVICPRQLLVFDTSTDKLILRYHFKETDASSISILVTLAVESLDRECKETFAYAADVTGFGIIVFDERRRTSWRVTGDYFYPYPLSGYFDVNGDPFHLMDGVLGLALGPARSEAPAEGSVLYFHSMASDRESYVATKVLRNESLFLDGGNHAMEKMQVFDTARPSQVAPEAVDSRGVMFYSHLKENSLLCWDTRTSYGGENAITLDRDDVNLQFVSSVKVSRDAQEKEELWLLSDRFQKHMTGTINNDEVNYRILHGPIRDLVQGSKCDFKGGASANLADGRPRPRPGPQRPPYRPPSRPGGYGYRN